MRQISSWLLLTVSLAAVLLLDTDGEWVYFGDYALPSTCAFQSAGVDSCPSCGLTRSLVFLGQGNWSQSLATHPVGVLVALLILFHCAKNALWRHRERLGWIRRGEQGLAVLVIIALFSTWIGRIV